MKLSSKQLLTLKRMIKLCASGYDQSLMQDDGQCALYLKRQWINHSPRWSGGFVTSQGWELDWSADIPGTFATVKALVKKGLLTENLTKTASEYPQEVYLWTVSESGLAL